MCENNLQCQEIKRLVSLKEDPPAHRPAPLFSKVCLGLRTQRCGGRKLLEPQAKAVMLPGEDDVLSVSEDSSSGDRSSWAVYRKEQDIILARFSLSI